MAESTDRIRFECPKCGVALGAESHRAGAMMRCPKCYEGFRVPEAEPEVAAPAAEHELPPVDSQTIEDPIILTCQSCKTRLQARAHCAGTTIFCPKCGKLVRVPATEPEPPAPVGSWSGPSAPTQEKFPPQPRAPRGLNKAQMVVLPAFGKLRTALIALWLLAVLVLLFTMQVRLGRIERGISSMTPDVTRIGEDLQHMKVDLSSVDKKASSIDIDVTSIETDLSHIELDVSSIGTDVSSIKTKVSSIETDVSCIETDVSSIETDVSHIKIWGVEIEK